MKLKEIELCTCHVIVYMSCDCVRVGSSVHGKLACVRVGSSVHGKLACVRVGSSVHGKLAWSDC